MEEHGSLAWPYAALRLLPCCYSILFLFSSIGGSVGVFRVCKVFDYCSVLFPSHLETARLLANIHECGVGSEKVVNTGRGSARALICDW